MYPAGARAAAPTPMTSILTGALRSRRDRLQRDAGGSAAHRGARRPQAAAMSALKRSWLIRLHCPKSWTVTM